jgi:uncharacterized protein YdcH (DUF465 family)
MVTSMTLREIREHAAADDAEFQKLSQEHSEYEKQLQQLSTSPYLSSEDILLEAELKKKKLRLKDLMERRIALLSKSS